MRRKNSRFYFNGRDGALRRPRRVQRRNLCDWRLYRPALRDSARSTWAVTAQRAVPARAFTLIEMMVVVVLIGIMAALVIPEMKGSFNDALLRSASRDLVNVFGLASSRAVSLNQCYRVKFDLDNGDYELERRVHDGASVDFVPAKDVPGAEGKVDQRISVRITFPDDDSQDNNANPGESSQTSPDAISFYPDGTADAAQIRLADRDGFQLLMQLNPITARVRISAPQHE